MEWGFAYESKNLEWNGGFAHEFKNSEWEFANKFYKTCHGSFAPMVLQGQTPISEIAWSGHMRLCLQLVSV